MAFPQSSRLANRIEATLTQLRLATKGRKVAKLRSTASNTSNLRLFRGRASVKSLASKRGVYVTLSSSLSPIGGSSHLTQMGRIEPLTQMGRTEPGQARLSASGSLRVDY